MLRHPETGEAVQETHCLCIMCNFAHMELSPEAKIVMPSVEEMLALIVKELFAEED